MEILKYCSSFTFYVKHLKIHSLLYLLHQYFILKLSPFIIYIYILYYVFFPSNKFYFNIDINVSNILVFNCTKIRIVCISFPSLLLIFFLFTTTTTTNVTMQRKKFIPSCCCLILQPFFY